MRSEAGGILVDGVQVASTHQCSHCSQHFVMVPGSGRVRGFCTRCQALTCGAAACMPCVPAEARLEHAEGKKTRYDSAIRELIAEGAALL